MPVAGPGEIISVRYVPNTPESDMRLGEYAEIGAVITYPTEAELLSMSRGNGGVLLYSDNDVEFNLNYNKAIPFTVMDYSDRLIVIPYLPNIPIVLSNDIIDYIYNNPEDERTIMNMTMGTPYGNEEMAISSQMALEEFFYGVVPLGDNHQAVLALGEYMNMFAYSAGGEYNFMSMNVVNPDDDTVVGEFTFNTRPERVIPDPMNNFKLIEGDAITFTLDKNINALAAVWAYTEGDTWNNELLSAIIPCQEEVMIEAEKQIYHVTYNDNVITLSTMEDGHDDRVTRDVGVWLYIPNETVNVQSVSQNVDIDVKHFSTGTCIYFYLAALNN